MLFLLVHIAALLLVDPSVQQSGFGGSCLQLSEICAGHQRPGAVVGTRGRHGLVARGVQTRLR